MNFGTQSECAKIQARKTSNTDSFYAVDDALHFFKVNWCCSLIKYLVALQSLRGVCEKAFLKDLPKFRGKDPCWNFFFTKLLNVALKVYQRQISVQIFSCYFCGNFQNICDWLFLWYDGLHPTLTVMIYTPTHQNIISNFYKAFWWCCIDNFRLLNGLMFKELSGK